MIRLWVFHGIRIGETDGSVLSSVYNCAHRVTTESSIFMIWIFSQGVNKVNPVVSVKKGCILTGFLQDDAIDLPLSSLCCVLCE